MHTHRAQSVTFNFNSDFSGEVIITPKAGGESLSVLGTDLLNFIAQEYIMPARIKRIEESSTLQLLSE
jgi:hypothetical protein